MFYILIEHLVCNIKKTLDPTDKSGPKSDYLPVSETYIQLVEW